MALIGGIWYLFDKAKVQTVNVGVNREALSPTD
jgi:hypothetical protein